MYQFIDFAGWRTILGTYLLHLPILLQVVMRIVSNMWLTWIFLQYMYIYTGAHIPTLVWPIDLDLKSLG